MDERHDRLGRPLRLSLLRPSCRPARLDHPRGDPARLPVGIVDRLAGDHRFAGDGGMAREPPHLQQQALLLGDQPGRLGDDHHRPRRDRDHLQHRGHARRRRRRRCLVRGPARGQYQRQPRRLFDPIRRHRPAPPAGARLVAGALPADRPRPRRRSGDHREQADRVLVLGRRGPDREPGSDPLHVGVYHARLRLRQGGERA